MVLDFGLLRSGLFPESELSGTGLGSDTQQTIVGQGNMRQLQVNIASMTGNSTNNHTAPDFTNFNSLMLTIRLKNTGTSANPTDFFLRINNDSGANYAEISINNITFANNTGQTGFHFGQVATTNEVYGWLIFDLTKSGVNRPVQGRFSCEGSTGGVHTFVPYEAAVTGVLSSIAIGNTNNRTADYTLTWYGMP